MPVVIPDDVLRKANLTEREALIEIACRLYDVGKLHLWAAAQLAGLSRVEFEEALISRGLPVYRYTEEDFQEDLAAIEHLEKLRKAEG